MAESIKIIAEEGKIALAVYHGDLPTFFFAFSSIIKRMVLIHFLVSV